MGVLKDQEIYIVSADRLADDGIPSCSIAFQEDPTGPVQSHVITRGDENSEIVYQACSISKPITALAVARLVDQGKLTYDTKLVDHLPKPILDAIVDDKTRHLLQYVTVELLVSHRSGLSQHGFPGYVDEPAGYREIVAGKSPSNTARMKFLSMPGSQCSYSGGGYVLLQILLEHITWTPFPQLMQEIVLGPLGMTRSRYGDAAPGDNNYARAYVTAYTPGTHSKRGYHRFTELAAAGLWTTPSDLLKATSAIQQSLHHPCPDSFLSQSTARKMLTQPSPFDSTLTMALGWTADSIFFAHSGSNEPGYLCYLLAVHAPPPPATRTQYMNSPRLMTLAIMTNSSCAWPTIRRLVASIFCFKAWPLYETLPAFREMKTVIPYEAPEGVYMHESWKAFIGQWSREEEEQEKTEQQNMSSPPSRAPTFTFSAGPTPTPPTTCPSTPQSLITTLHLSQGGTRTGEFEIYEESGMPMLAFDAVREGARLRPGAIPWLSAEKFAAVTFVVEGLEMAVRLCSGIEEVTKREEYHVELVQESGVVKLTRV